MRRCFSSEHDLLSLSLSRLSKSSPSRDDRHETKRLISITNRSPPAGRISVANKRSSLLPSQMTTTEHEKRSRVRRESKEQITAALPNNANHSAASSSREPNSDNTSHSRNSRTTRSNELSVRDCLQIIGGLRSLQRGTSSVEVLTTYRTYTVYTFVKHRPPSTCTHMARYTELRGGCCSFVVP